MTTYSGPPKANKDWTEGLCLGLFFGTVLAALGMVALTPDMTQPQPAHAGRGCVTLSVR